MNKLIRNFVCSTLALLLVVAPLARAKAQDATVGGKPVAVVSIASLNKILGDVSYLTKTAGQEDAGQMVVFMAGAMTQGVDKQKPAGLYVTMDGGMPKVLGFLPVTNLQQVFLAFREQLGEPEDVGDGIFEVAQDKPQSAFVKQQGGWAFFAQSKDDLAKLPQNPAKLLGGLPNQYDVGVTVFVQNIPEELRQMAVDQLKIGFEQSLEQGLDAQDPEQRELTEKLGRNSIKQMGELINGVDEITFGWGVDDKAKSTFIDLSMTAVNGSKLARQMALLRDTKSSFAGFLQPGAAVTMNLSSQTAPEDVEQLMLMLKTVRAKAMEEISKDDGLPDEATRNQVKEILGSVMDVVEKTLQAGKLDGGAVLVLNPKEIGFAAGGFVADGPALDDAFRKLIDLAKNEPEFPEVKLNAAKHGEVNFHSLKVPVDDPEASRVVGDELDVVVGTGPQSIYVAFGKNALSLLKSVIDKSQQDASKTVPSMQMNVTMGPIVKFAASIEENPITTALQASLEKVKGNDRVLISAKSIKKGVSYRFEVEEGVILMIGEAVKSMGGGGPALEGGF